MDKTKKSGVKISDPRRKWAVIGVVTILVFGGAGAYFVSRSSATDCQQIELHNGSVDASKSGCVSKLQHFLNVMGYTQSSGQLQEDGKFGSKTELAVREAQKAVGVAVDGWYGPKTKAAMCAAAIAKSKESNSNPDIITAANQSACTASESGSTSGSGGNSSNNNSPLSDSSDTNDDGDNTTNNGGGSGGSSGGNTPSGGGNSGNSGSTRAAAPTCKIAVAQLPVSLKDTNPKLTVTNGSNETIPGNSLTFRVKITGAVTGKLVSDTAFKFPPEIPANNTITYLLYPNRLNGLAASWGQDRKMIIAASGPMSCSTTIMARSIGPGGPQL